MFATDHPIFGLEQEWFSWKGFLCMNCVQVAANDEWSGVDERDPVPLNKVPEGIYVIVACCDPKECDFDHVHLPDLDDDQGIDCDGCGMREAGIHPAVGDDRK